MPQPLRSLAREAGPDRELVLVEAEVAEQALFPDHAVPVEFQPGEQAPGQGAPMGAKLHVPGKEQSGGEWVSG